MLLEVQGSYFLRPGPVSHFSFAKEKAIKLGAGVNSNRASDEAPKMLDSVVLCLNLWEVFSQKSPVL
jgi:hypothetical protein